MTYKNAKTILFAGFIAAMIIPVSMNQSFAESTNNISIAEETLYGISAYIIIHEDKTISLDIGRALQDGVSEEIIRHGIKIMEEQNALVRGEIIETTVLSNYFKDPVFKNQLSSQTCNWDGAETPYVAIFDTYSTTLSSAQDFLSGIGYHNVAWYALHPNAWGNPAVAERDFQQSVTAFGCENGVFRVETYIGDDFTEYRLSVPEPNPEYLDNSWEWPVWYWPIYVVDWHAEN